MAVVYNSECTLAASKSTYRFPTRHDASTQLPPFTLSVHRGCRHFAVCASPSCRFVALCPCIFDISQRLLDPVNSLRITRVFSCVVADLDGRMAVRRKSLMTMFSGTDFFPSVTWVKSSALISWLSLMSVSGTYWSGRCQYQK